MIIKEFLRFIYESKYDLFSETVASEVLEIIKQGKDGSVKKRICKSTTYDEPVSFELTVTITRSLKFSASKKTGFNEVPWEEINFRNNGFSIDSNSFIPVDASEPDVEISILINPETEPDCYQLIYFKLLDAIRHELEHLLQKGLNRNTQHTGSEVDKERKAAASSYRYFLLPDEIPSMVSGMRLSAEKKGTPIDQEFSDYLIPILQGGFITQDQFDFVIKTWLTFTIKHFPDTKISSKYRIH